MQYVDWVIHNVLSVSAVQQSDSVIPMPTSFLPSFPHGLSQDTEYSVLCCPGPGWFIHSIYKSLHPLPENSHSLLPHPLPLGNRKSVPYHM